MTGLMPEKEFSRKSFVKGGGALIVGFSLAGAGLAAKSASSATARSVDASLGGPWSTPPTTSLDSWLKVGQDGRVTAFGSRTDSGQGTTTGFVQIIADELDVAFDSVTLITGDTARVPNNGDIGSASGIIIQSQPLRYAAAEARLALLNLASTRLGVPVAQLSVSNGVVSATANPAQKVSYGELIGGQLLNVTLRQVNLPGVPVRSGAVAYASNSNAPVKAASQYKVIGTSVPRFDIPDKVTGKFTYAHNVRLPGMVHARLVVPPSPSSNLVKINGFKGPKPPGLIRVFAKGNFVAVVAEQEWQAIQAMSSLDVVWTDPTETLSGNGNLNGSLRTSPTVIPDVTTTRAARAQGQSNNPNRGDVKGALASAAKVLTADYYFPIHTHGSIGPACAVADVREGQAVCFAPAGSIYTTQGHVAGVLGIPTNNVRIISTEGSGQYGKVSLSEDTAPAAALISQAVGRPVRLQLMRPHDMVTDPYGVPYSYRLQGGIDGKGNVIAWSTEFWTWAINPQTEGPTLTDMLTGAAQAGPYRGQSIQALGGGDLNAYEFPNESFLGHHVAPQLRVGSGNMRSPKRIQGNFAVESFIDELAAAAGVDAIAFRIQQIQNTQKVVATAEPNFDPSHYQRQLATVEALRTAMNWESRPSPAPGARGKTDVVTGRGVATMGNYTNVFGTMGAEVEVNKKTGRVKVIRLVNVVDPGLIINPRAARNTIEQGVLFALSRTLHEELRFDQKSVLSRDWVSYPIMRFLEVPDQEVVLINRPEYWGGGLGEGNEIMVSAVIGNAIFDATGLRLREVPFTPARVRAALKAAGLA
jgi:nicotinate dehydrogenase subunit B